MIALHPGIPGTRRAWIDLKRVQRSRGLGFERDVRPGGSAVRGRKKKAVVRARNDESLNFRYYANHFRIATERSGCLPLGKRGTVGCGARNQSREIQSGCER